MTRKKNPPPMIKAMVATVATGLAFPSREAKPPAKGAGVQGVRRPESGGPRAHTMAGFVAAEACKLFGRPNKGGGAAFLVWLQSEQPDALKLRQSAAQWAPLLAAFAARPIHGHRRTAQGGNHRINKQHRRK